MDNMRVLALDVIKNGAAIIERRGERIWCGAGAGRLWTGEWKFPEAFLS